MAIIDQRIHQNRKKIIRTDQQTTLLSMNLMEKLFYMTKLMQKTRKVHIISGLDIFSKKEFNMKEKDSENLEKEVLT